MQHCLETLRPVFITLMSDSASNSRLHQAFTTLPFHIEPWYCRIEYYGQQPFQLLADDEGRDGTLC